MKERMIDNMLNQLKVQLHDFESKGNRDSKINSYNLFEPFLDFFEGEDEDFIDDLIEYSKKVFSDETKAYSFLINEDPNLELSHEIFTSEEVERAWREIISEPKDIAIVVFFHKSMKILQYIGRLEKARRLVDELGIDDDTFPGEILKDIFLKN